MRTGWSRWPVCRPYLPAGWGVLAELARFGFVTDLLSKPIRLGYLNGIALTVLVGQLPKVLGFPASGDGLKSYHDITRYPAARRIPGLILFRWDAPLFFANAEAFREHILSAVADAPTPTKCVVVAAEQVTDIDITAPEVLASLEADLEKAGIELCFAEMKDPVKDPPQAIRFVHTPRAPFLLPDARSGGGCVYSRAPRGMVRLGGCGVTTGALMGEQCPGVQSVLAP